MTTRMTTRRHPIWRASVPLALVLAATVLAPFAWTIDPDLPLAINALKLQPPTLLHPLGTDIYSRDLLARVLAGARISLAVGIGAALLAAALGTGAGLLAGTGPAWLDRVLMRVVDALLSIPRVLLVIALAATFGTLPVGALVLVVGCTGWYSLARLVRDGARAASRRDFADAARALGVSRWRLAWRHVLPTLSGTIVVASVLTVGNAIAIEAGLSYLGLGVQPPASSWGTLIHDGTEVLGLAWWTSVFPGIAIVGTVFGCQTLAAALEARLGGRSALAASSR